ncbi:transporter [Methylorubrum sp. SB2]|uniref:transporter n=1 Tax=Methylorubrum subtropicum TaxID=3138812 RepID=UPI00313B1EC2
MMKNWLAAGAVALTVGMTTTVAQAQTTTVPGEQVGLAVGAPLPEGIYAINTFTYGGRDQGALDVGVNIPILVWATPWVPMGGRLEFVVAPPTVFAFGKNSGPGGIRDFSVNVGTFVGGIWAFDLGGNFGVSLLGGVYLNELNGDRGVARFNSGAVAVNPVLPFLASNTYRFGVAGSYTGDGWNATANLTYNFYDSPATFSGNNTFGTRGPFNISDALNLDLTATKKFGKFEIGAIGYGTVNLDPNLLNRVGDLGSGRIGRGGRFLLGGLIGYDFGAFTTQFYVARTVARTADSFDSTEGWFRIVAPLYTPPAPVAVAPAPLVRKY